MLVINGLGEIADHPILQGAVAESVVRVCGDENRRDPMPRINQVSVELDPGHSRHVNVRDQAGGLSQQRRDQEARRRRKRFDRVAQQTHEFSHGFAKGLIVLDDRDESMFRHCGFQAVAPRARPKNLAPA